MLELGIEHDSEDIRGFVGGDPGATFFHTPAWIESLSTAFPTFEPLWVTARTGSRIAGVMPLVRIRRGPFFSLTSMPFGTYGTPLSGDDSIRASLIGKVMDLSGSFFCLETMINMFGLDRDRLPVSSSLIRMRECSLVELTGTFDEYRSTKLSKKKRQLCNRCEKAGVEVRELTSQQEVDEFYEVYRNGSAGWGGVHPYPGRFFDELYRRKDDGVLFLGAFLDGQLIGGHIYMFSGHTVQAWQAGVTSRSHELEVAAYLVYNAIMEGYARGKKILNLGSSAGDEGMLFFKRSMGGSSYRYPAIETRKSWWKILRKR